MRYRDLFDVRGRYLNNASLSPLPKETIKSMVRYLREREREGGRCELDWFHKIEEVRERASRLFNAKLNEISLVKSTTHGITLVAQGFPWNEGDEVLLVRGEFPANIYPWLSLRDRGVKVRFVEPQDGRVDVETLEDHIGERTRLLALSFVDYLTGHRRDLKEIGDFLEERGIHLSVDAIQGLGVIPLDLSSVSIDFLSSGGTKWLMGPMGTGIFYVREKVLDLLKVPLLGWRSVRDFMDFSHYTTELREDARRFESDTYNLCGLIGLGASLKLILEMGVEDIKERVLSLTEMLLREIESLERVEILTPRSRSSERSGIVSFKVRGVPSEELKNHLQAKGITVSEREGWIRVSPHFYNEEEEIEALIAEIRDRATL